MREKSAYPLVGAPVAAAGLGPASVPRNVTLSN
jgi:hypothetical protein